MFCGKCGAAVPDGAAFCGSCGAPLSAPVAPAAQPVAPAPVPAPVQPPVQEPVQPVAPTPVQQVQPVVQAPVQPVEPPVAQPAPAQPVAFADPFAPAAPAAPKKKGKGLVTALIALVAAAAVFVTCIAGPLWLGWFPNTKLTKQITKWFGSEDAYMSAVEAETVDTLSDTISKGYGNAINGYKEILSGDKYTNTTISLEVGDVVREMLISAIPETDSVDVAHLMSLLDGTSISIGGGKTGDAFQMAIGLGLGGKHILDVAMILDMVNQEAFAAVPTLSDLYLDVSQIFDEANIDSDSLAAVDQLTSVIDALPSEEVVNKLLAKYIQLALDQFDDVSKDSDTIKVGGIEEKVTVLETKITEKAVMKAGEAILDAVKDDKDVKDIIIKLGNAIGELNGEEDYGEELYEEFSDSLDSMSGESASAYARGTGTALGGAYDADEDDYNDEPPTMSVEEESYVVLTDYVNGSHEIIGRKLSTHFDGEKQDMVYYATTKKGNNFAFTLEVQGTEVVSGKGTDNKGVINGSFDIIVEDQDVATVKVSDFNSNGIKEGNLKGSFTVTLSEDIMEQLIDEVDLPADVTSALSLLDCSLQIDVETSVTGGYIRIALCNGSKNLLGIKVETAFTDEKVSVPEADKVVDMDEIDQWLESVDISELVNNLKKAGFPSELLDMLEAAFENGFGAMEEPGYNEPALDDWYNEPVGDDPYNDAPLDGWYDQPVEDDWYTEPSGYIDGSL